MCIYDVYGPCSCPHGRCFTLLAQCFTIASWVASMVAATSCFYMYVRPIPEEGMPEQPREGFGFLARQAKIQEPPSFRECVWWDGDELDLYFDGMWRAGKAMGILTVVIGFIVMCIILCTCCVAYQLPTFDGLFWTSMFCFAAQCLTFLSWGSEMCDEYECTWAPGSGTNISAAMLWLWAANMIKSFPEALPTARRGQRGGYYEEDDEYYDDSPYLNPKGGFDDEYYGEEDEWDPKEEQGYYDDDGEYYDENNEADYPEEEALPDHEKVEGSPDSGFEEPYDLDGDDDEYLKDQYSNDNLYSTDYTEPEAIESSRPGQAPDDGFEVNSELRDNWSGTDNDTFDDSTAEENYFRQSDTDLSSGQGDLSQEELEFLGGSQSLGSTSMEDLD